MMAISRQNKCRDLLVTAMAATGKPMPLLRIAELGNQRIKGERASGLPRVSKQALEFFGASVVSIDLNGRDGALPLDLSKPLPEVYEVPSPEDAPSELIHLRHAFDLVTDFGTLEHVWENQWQAFANVHHLCRLGGVMCHALPMPGTRHGPRDRTHKYTARWFVDHVARCGQYELIDATEQPKQPDGTEMYVYVVLRKTIDCEFTANGWVDPPGVVETKAPTGRRRRRRG